MSDKKFKVWEKHDKGWADPSGFIGFINYTGLKDKNGVGIYNGDIVCQKTGRSHTEVKTVEFRDGAFRYKNKKTPHAGFVYTDSNTEVIGNIYKNPLDTKKET